MIRRVFCLRSLPICCLMLFVAATVRADDPPPGSKAISLFDGKSLEGWKQTDFHRSGKVKVEKGTIQLEQSDGMTGITTTRKDLPKIDYELNYEAMRVVGDDFFAAATVPVGNSFVTFVNGGWGGSVTGLSSLDGADASENETTVGYKYENKKWYKFRIRVTAEVIRCWIDDKPMAEVKIKDRQVSTRLEVRENQPLGFATWETGGALRNLSIRPLTASEIKQHNQLEDK